MNAGFHYRLKLPVFKDSDSNEQLKAKVNVLNLAPTSLEPFKCAYSQNTAYA
jgi:hypothetical protein